MTAMTAVGGRQVIPTPKDNATEVTPAHERRGSFFTDECATQTHHHQSAKGHQLNVACGMKVFDPRSKQSGQWDGLVAVLLIYTAYVTPYEVAFLESGVDTPSKMGLFVFNRFVDVIFTLDLVRTFFTPFFNHKYQEWVTAPGAISKRYLTGWFTIDFVSILPFDTVGVVAESDAVSQLKAARVVRLFRLLKLLRLVRGMRLIQKWQDQIGLLHVHKQLLSFLVLMVTSAHWIACLWRLATDIEAATNSAGQSFSWMTNFVTGPGEVNVKDQAPGVQYAASLYWSVMTLTSIGRS
jgi:potassium voltage-gated channel Eag-related subfamily H protein 7